MSVCSYVSSSDQYTTQHNATDIFVEVLTDPKLNFPIFIPDLCNHAWWREIICGQLGNSDWASLARRSEMAPRNREEEGQDHQQIRIPNFDSFIFFLRFIETIMRIHQTWQIFGWELSVWRRFGGLVFLQFLLVC